MSYLKSCGGGSDAEADTIDPVVMNRLFAIYGRTRSADSLGSCTGGGYDECGG